jgi:hypothetical protein
MATKSDDTPTREGPQVRFKTDVKQQHQHPDLSQEQQRRVRAEKREFLRASQQGEKIAQSDPRQQFPKDRGLPPALGQ